MGTWIETHINLLGENLERVNTFKYSYWSDIGTKWRPWMRRWRIEFSQNMKTGRGYRGFCVTEEEV